jgi:hypothetical protein
MIKSRPNQVQDPGAILVPTIHLEPWVAALPE